MRRAIVTVGLGFGDEGKGATVDFLCRRLGADLVVRYSGGSQAGHNVELPDGRRHTFSQFGAGTFAGVPTWLAEPVVINPTALVKEADHLVESGIPSPFETLSVHPRCLVSTDLHQAVNQLRELARGDARHGSCGHGIGETRNYHLRYGDDAVFARDLVDRAILRSKLELLRQRMYIDLQDVVPLVDPASLAEYDLLGLTADDLAAPLLEIGSRLRFSDDVPEHSTAIYEGAQGVLLDEWFGFHPHTTWSTVTPHHALELAIRSKTDELCVLGIVRAVMTRHGSGPLPTFDEALTARLNDVGNPPNPWQGSIRAGALDMVLLRHAARACGRIDNLAVSCLDHVSEGGRLCRDYGDLADLPPVVAPNLRQQERVGELLARAVPRIVPAGEDDVLAALAEIAPVAIKSNGPTHEDRVMTSLRIRMRTLPSL